MGSGALSEELPDDTAATLFSENVAVRNAEEWLLQTDYAASKSSLIQKQAKRRAERVKNILLNVLPDVTNIRFRVPRMVQGKPQVEFKTPYGWVPIRGLGLGYRTMIAWTVDLASRLFDRYPDSPDPIAEPAVVLVDEIDLHMHPQWQRKIMNYLSERFKNTQFIVTAHSPLIVQAATDANIAVLRHEGDHVFIDQSIKAVRGWRIDQVLTSDLFGLKSARGKDFDALMDEREKLLSKKRLTKKDKARLQDIGEQLSGAPVGETPTDIEALNILRRAAMSYKSD